MQDIKQREIKMQETRKKTPWRDFVKQICSRRPLMFYKHNGLICRFPDTERMHSIVSYKEFETEREWFLDKGHSYDLGKSFFENYHMLFDSLPLFTTMHIGGNENSEFSDGVYFCKNVYLSSAVVFQSENCLYSFHVKEGSRNVLNSMMVRDHCENIYFSASIIKSYSIFYSRYIINSSNIWFSSNLMGCHDCIFCNDLENQSYCIENRQYSKEEFISNKDQLLRDKEVYLSQYLQLTSVGKNFNSSDAQGNFLINSDKIENGNLTYNLHEGRNCILTGWADREERMVDCFMGGSPYAIDNYACVGGDYEHNYCCDLVTGSIHIFHCAFLENCSYCLWCIGLKNKSFCILNNQYSKEERFELADKIFAQMERDWILWAFFPASMNPFYFNDTAAYLIDDSFTKEEVTKEWYLRRDDEIKVDVPANADMITTKDLNQYQWFNQEWDREINPEILKKVIKDEKWNYYRIVPMELEFLQKHRLPLPEIHRLERIKLGFKFK